MSHSNTSQNEHRPLRAAVAAAGLVIALATAVAAVVYTNSSTSRDLIDRSTTLDAARSTLGANDLALKAISQAALLGEDLALGVADAATVETALIEAQRTLDELSAASAALEATIGANAEVAAARAAAMSLGAEVLALIQNGEVIAASELLTTSGKPTFETMRDTVSLLHGDAAGDLARADNVVSKTANLAKFFVAFLIPVAAIVTYRVIARRQLRFAEVELDARLAAEQEIVRSKDEFVAGISHELRTPLTSIYGFSELLLEQGIIDPDTALELVGVIHAESAELSRMVEDLLTAARADADLLRFRMGEVDVADEVDLVVEPVARTGAVIEVDLAAGRIWADGNRLRQILRNLLSNAVRHGAGDVRVVGRVEDGRYAISVEDQGDGVPSETEPRLFTRFVHEGEDSLTEGSVGLGLAVVKMLADAMDGDVAYSRADGHTIFTVHLPLAANRDGLTEESWQGRQHASVFADLDPGRQPASGAETSRGPGAA